MATKQKSAICAVLSVLLLAMGFIGCGGGDKMTLPIELQTRIRQDYFNQFVMPYDNSIELSLIQIERVYGTFSEFIVVRFYPVFGVPGVIRPIEIGGVWFDYNFASRIIAWKDGQMYTIIDAFENSSLSKTDIQNIASIDNLPLN